MDITRRSTDKWTLISAGESANGTLLCKSPFASCLANVKPDVTKTARESSSGDVWWRHVEPRPGMWQAIDFQERYIATPTVAKHRLFVRLLPRICCADHQLIVITHGDDTAFGILHAGFTKPGHCGLVLARRRKRSPLHADHNLRDLPLPDGLTPNIPAEHTQRTRARSRSPRRRSGSTNCARRG